MNSLEDILERIQVLINEGKPVTLRTSTSVHEGVLIEDVFIHDATLRIQYDCEGELHVVPLVQLLSIDDISIYDLLGLSNEKYALSTEMLTKENSLVTTNDFTVTSLNRHIRERIENDVSLSDVLLRAEMVNVSYSSQGHLYFSLKEEDSLIKAVHFGAKKVSTKVFEEGDAVEVIGDVKVYDKMGVYQLVVKTIRSMGVGNFHERYEKLKKELAERGMFDIERKSPLPKYPKIVGIITSVEGAAIEDILKVWQGRLYFNVKVYPSLVQGKSAALDIVKNIDLVNIEKEVDVLLITRGGGSSEDLWVFNEKEVVEAICGSHIPVVTAIGHEIDLSLSDLASDRHFPTPTAAAFFFMECFDELLMTLEHFRLRLNGFQKNYYKEKMYQLDNFKQKVIFLMKQKLEEKKRLLNQHRMRLEAFSPKGVLERGYVMVLDANGKWLRLSKELMTKDGSGEKNLRLVFADGEVHVTIKKGGSSGG